MPPKESKHDDMRYFDIHEDDGLDDDQIADWIEQASKSPGVKVFSPSDGAHAVDAGHPG